MANDFAWISEALNEAIMRTLCFLALVFISLSLIIIICTTHKKKHDSKKEIDIFFQLFLPIERYTKHRRHHHHTKGSLVKEARTKSKQCKLVYLKSYDDCIEIGCKPGEPCRAKALKNFQCCAHVYLGKLISCCQSNFTCPRPILKKPEKATETRTRGCPPELIPPNYNCMEMGCVPGEPCNVEDLAGNMCCRHVTSRGTEVSCCLTDPSYDLSNSTLYYYRFKREIPEPVHQDSPYKNVSEKHPRADIKCPPKPFIPLFHCMKVECKLGEPCQLKTLENRKCCPHTFQNQDINCCMKVPALRGISGVKLDCPKLKKGVKFDCLEIGCEYRKPCTHNPDVQCCHLKHNDMFARCCLSPSSLRAKQGHITKSSVDSYCFSQPGKEYNCFNVGCNPGTPCGSIGRPNDECCMYVYQGIDTACCLVEVDSENADVDPHVLHSPTVSERCLAMSLNENYDCLALGCTEGTSCVSEDLPDYDCCMYEDANMEITCCLMLRVTQNALPPSCYLPERMGQPECLPKGCPSTDGFTAFSECMEFGCKVGSRCTAHGAEDKRCCPFLIDGQYITCCPMLLRRRSMFFAVPKKLSPERQNDLSTLGGWNCIEMGCVAGENCVTEGLESEKCKRKKVDNLTITCCESLPRPEGCNYIVRSGINYDCIDIGCKLKTKCSTKNTLDPICCPYTVNRQQVTCCLIRRED